MTIPVKKSFAKKKITFFNTQISLFQKFIVNLHAQIN